MNEASRKLLAGVMLLAFLVRAVVPVGFMPASDQPFSIEICPEGFPAHLLAQSLHHHHGGAHWGAEHCVFGSACAGGPLSHHPLLTHAASAMFVFAAPRVAAAIPVRLVHLPQVRGPPLSV